MTLSRLDRQLIVSAGITAAWLGKRDAAAVILEALPWLVRDIDTRHQCEKIFAVLLDKKRLTQPSYCTSDALLEALSDDIQTPATRKIIQPV